MSLALDILLVEAVNKKINRPHEKGLRALLNDKTSAFNEMLTKSNDTTIHAENIQIFVIYYSTNISMFP